MYLILIDEHGERITSLAIGVHGNSMDELKEVAKGFNPTIMLEADDELQHKACGNVIYKDGAFVEKPPSKPSVQEQKQQIKDDYAVRLDRLVRAKVSTELMGRDSSEVAKAYQRLIKEQKEALDKVKE